MWATQCQQHAIAGMGPDCEETQLAIQSAKDPELLPITAAALTLRAALAAGQHATGCAQQVPRRCGALTADLTDTTVGVSAWARAKQGG